jgi:hypothetical protein
MEKGSTRFKKKILLTLYYHFSYVSVAWIVAVRPGDTRHARARVEATRGSRAFCAPVVVVYGFALVYRVWIC